MSWKDKDLGPVDAYAEAVAAGYTGTRAEWLLEVGSVKENAQAAARSATSAAGSANDANTAKAAAQAAQAAVEQYTAEAIDDWLDGHIDPETGYALDTTLSLSNAAAPANKVGDLKSAFDYRTSNDLLIYNFENVGISGNVGEQLSKSENTARVSTTIVPILAFVGMSVTVNSDYDIFHTIVSKTGTILSKANSWKKSITLNESSGYVIFTLKKASGSNISVNEAISAITSVNFPLYALTSDESVSIHGRAADSYETRKLIEGSCSALHDEIIDELTPKPLYKILNMAPTSSGLNTTVTFVNSVKRAVTEKIPAFSGMKVIMNSGYSVSTYTVDSDDKQQSTTSWADSCELSPSSDKACYFVFKRSDEQILDAGELLTSGIYSTNLPLEQTPDIIFWGDSLTQGAGLNLPSGGSRVGLNYPSAVGQILRKSTFNCGVGGETSNTISCRQGANSVVIPVGAVNGTYNNGVLKDVFGGDVSPLRQGRQFAGWNHIIINGEICNISISQTSSTSSDAVYTISGYTGESVKFPTLGKFSGEKYKGKITCILVGTNGSMVGSETGVDARITIIDSMIAKLDNEKYIVVGIPVGKLTTKQAEEIAMINHFGSKYLPTLEPLIYYGLDICGLTATQQDEADIAAYYIPSSLRADGTHLNSDGYFALATLVANKIEAMGYLDA